MVKSRTFSAWARARRTQHSSSFGNLFGQHLVGRQAKDIGDVILFAPVHDLLAAVMTVAAKRDPRRRPVHANTPDKAADVTANLLPNRGLTRTENGQHAMATVSVV